MTYKHEVIVPFSGFYESIGSGEFDEAIESHLEWVNSDENEDRPAKELEYDDLKYDYNGYCLAYSKEYLDKYAEALNDKLDINIELSFKALDSPKYYNFTTDRIVAEISLDDARVLFKATAVSELGEYLKDIFTSYDGFSSFYSNDLKDWLSKSLEDWDCNEIGALLGCNLNYSHGDILFEIEAYEVNASEIALEFIGGE